MNTDFLRSFVEVARQGSYTKAAKSLYLSQPSVYQHVRTVEQLLGVSLVQQVGKKVLLTPEGKVVMDQALRVLGEVNHLLNSVLLDHHELRTGQLDVVVGTTFGQAILPLALGEFRGRYPGIAIRAPVLHNTDDIDDAVLRLGYDGAFHSGHQSRSGLDKQPVVEDVLVAITPPGHSLARRSRGVRPEDLVDDGIITYARPYGLRQTIDSWAGSRDVAVPSVVELNSQTAMVTAVSAGAGVSVVSLLSALPFMQAGTVVALELDPPLRRTAFFVHRSGFDVPLALARLAELVAQCADTAQRDGLRLVKGGSGRPARRSRPVRTAP